MYITIKGAVGFLVVWGAQMGSALFVPEDHHPIPAAVIVLVAVLVLGLPPSAVEDGAPVATEGHKSIGLEKALITIMAAQGASQPVGKAPKCHAAYSLAKLHKKK